jgi:hypothetical protein
VNYKPVAPTAIYHPDTNSWTAGPDLPHKQGAGDTWSSLLPNGNVLTQTNPPGITADHTARANARYASIRNGTGHLISAEAESPQLSNCPPTLIWRLYEFDGTNLIPEPAASMCNNQPSLLLADRRSDAEPQLRLQVHERHVSDGVEADDHQVHPEPR